MTQSLVSYTEDELKSTYAELISFFNDEPFQKVVAELFSIPDRSERFEFVKEQLINKQYLLAKGVDVPEDIIVQRSYFYDNRPTLFCLTKYLQDKKRKVTITIDDNAF